MRPNKPSSCSLPLGSCAGPDRPRPAIVLAAIVLVALALALPASVHSRSQQTSQSYRLGSGDTLTVSIVEAPELSFTSSIGAEGIVSLPNNMGTVSVSGLTVAEAEQAIRRRLERSLRSATVEIEVDRTRASSVVLLGAVKRPGKKDIGPRTTLYELLTRIDDIDPSNAGIVRVRRTSTAGLVEQVEIPLSTLLQEIEPRYNLPLANGDVITVPIGKRIKVYFVGEVSKEVTFDSSEPKTLVRAIAKAGGLTERSSGKLVITRTAADGTSRFVHAKYKRILDGRDPDIKLESGDVILVKRSVI